MGLDGIAQECASYKLYNSKHLKSCIADALETGEFQRRNNVIDGSTTVAVACEVADEALEQWMKEVKKAADVESRSCS